MLETVDMGPLSFWKENQHPFPALAAMARDTLSVPATGAGVERLFNTAHDICHYCQGQLIATIIQELMVFRCTSKFDIEEDEAMYLKEFLSENDVEARTEAKEDPDQLIIEAISDTEKQDVETPKHMTVHCTCFDCSWSGLALEDSRHVDLSPFRYT